MVEYRYHQFYDDYKLPCMSDEQLAELAADMAANGQRDDVILLDGVVIDGRNRIKGHVDFRASLVKYRVATKEYTAAIRELRYRCGDVVQEATRALVSYFEDGTRNSNVTLHIQTLSCADKLQLSYCIGQSHIALGPSLAELITSLAKAPRIFSQDGYDSAVEILSQEYSDEYCIDVVHWLVSKLLQLHAICDDREELVE